MFRLRGFQTLTLISFATRSSSLRTSTRGYMHVILFFVHSLLDEQIQILFLPLRPYFFGYPSMFRYHKSVWKFVITTNEEFVYKDYKHNQLNSFEMNQQALRISSDQSQATPCSFSVSILHNLQLTFFFFTSLQDPSRSLPIFLDFRLDIETSGDMGEARLDLAIITHRNSTLLHNTLLNSEKRSCSFPAFERRKNWIHTCARPVTILIRILKRFLFFFSLRQKPITQARPWYRIATYKLAMPCLLSRVWLFHG